MSQRISNVRWLSVAVLAALVGCSHESPTLSAGAPQASIPPATVRAPVRAGDVATIVLDPPAEQRLGIATASVALRDVPRLLLLGAEVVVPPGRSVLVSSPFAGALRAAGPNEPRAGGRVESGATVLELAPLLTPERDWLTPAEQIQAAKVRSDLEIAAARARGEREAAQARVALAQIAVQRTEALVEREAGSVRTRDEAHAELAQARSVLAAAEATVTSLAAITLDTKPGSPRPLALAAPLSGILTRVLAVPEQVVTAGTPLFEVSALERVWIRVPVYAGEVARIDSSAVARFGSLSNTAEVARRDAQPVVAPPSASAVSSTVDLWYELDNSDGALRPGERGSVLLALGGSEPRSCVPWSAVIYDTHGSAWVYQQVESHEFSRHRVEVERVEGDFAVLARGPADGALVVTAGVAELHGIEFGNDK